MTQLSYATDQHAIKVAKTLAGLAILAALTAAAAGLVLLIANPESGSTLESTLGVTAAVAGLSTAVFAVTGLIYAQVKNLWQNVPNRIRAAAWVILAAVAVFNIIRSLI
jgi:membrane associated rhomboid family serine protease